MDPVQKLLQLLSVQSKDIDQSTQLTISTLNEEEIKYSITKNSLIKAKSLKNTYRIQLKPNMLSFRQYLIEFINKFQVKKLVINVNNLKIFDFSWEILKNIHFQEVRLLQGVKPQIQQENILLYKDKHNQVQQKLQKVLTNGPDFDLLKIQLNATCKQLVNLLRVIEKFKPISSQKEVENKLEKLKIEQKQKGFRVTRGKNRKFRYIFHLQIYQEEQLLYLIYLWTQQKISSYQTFKEELILTGNFYQMDQLFPLNKLQDSNINSIQMNEALLKQLKNEVIMIYIKEEHILTLSSCSDYGYNIRLGKKLSIEQTAKKIINKVLSSPYFISLEVEEESNSLLDIVDFVFHNYHYHSNYLIKIGNQVQLTSYRMMLNTNNLPSVIVRRLIKLLQFPGHYEFIFYGSLDYFEQVRLLFMQKPFTKFNYFLPIQQVSNEVCQLIGKMESIADEFKQKVIQFCSLLKDFSYKQINLIEDVYINLHLKDFEEKK